jgi:hypothetical protein
LCFCVIFDAVMRHGDEERAEAEGESGEEEEKKMEEQV